MRKPIIIALVVFIAAAGGLWFYRQASVPGFWALDQEASSLAFSSLKNGDVEETHTFHGITGEVDFTGSFEIEVDLRTVDTGIQIRDERMGHYLFETESYPVATISGTFLPAPFGDLAVDGVMVTRVNATLSLHGVERPVSADVTVKRLQWDQVTVETVNPIIIKATDFDLDGGIEELRQIAGLQSISGTVPVTFSFIFNSGATP